MPKKPSLNLGKNKIMIENKKQIADHHDNVIRLNVEVETIIDDYKYNREKIERENLYLKTSGDRVVDMKISNYDKIIDLEIFLLKLFIPILGISFATGVNIIGIDTRTLKWMSLLVIILVGLLIVVTLIFRKRIVASEQKFHERQLDSIKKETTNRADRLETRIKQLGEDIKLALENEPSL